MTAPPPAPHSRGRPHPGFRAGIIAGGAIWLIQFALAVVLFHRRALSRPAG